jgi:MFS family permease
MDSTRETTGNDQVRDYPDELDTGLLKIAGVCVLASVMAILDATVVIVAQQTFIAEFSSTYAVVAWTMTGYTLSLAVVIPLTGWAAQRFGTKRLTMFLFVIAFFGVELLFPSYLQQLLSQTRTQSGMHLIPLALGAATSMPIAGRHMDKRGPGKVVPVGIALVATGMSAFTYGVSQHTVYTPVLLLALLVMGMGTGCTLTPISASAMRALKPTEVARGATLLNVNRQVAGAIGTALMSTILTDQLNRGARVRVMGNTTDQVHLTTESTLSPGFSNLSPEHINHGLSHAYAVVFAVAVGLVMFAITPALVLSKKSAQSSPAASTPSALEH